MERIDLIKQLELFNGLDDNELVQIASICKEKEYSRGDFFAREGEPGSNFCIIEEGVMSIKQQASKHREHQTMVRLGRGQLVGEMSLVDRGVRSASVRVLQTPTRVIEVSHKDFHTLCESAPRIGYVVMKNIAADLSFKLRHSAKGTRRWRG